MDIKAVLKFDTIYQPETKNIVPDSTLKKVFYFFNEKRFSEKLKVQIFKCSEVLQKIADVFYTSGIKNIVKLGKDFHDVYVDHKNDTIDFEPIIKEFCADLASKHLEHFDLIELLAELRRKNIVYTYEVFIKRIHRSKESPIEIRIYGRYANNYKKQTNRRNFDDHIKSIRNKLNSTDCLVERFTGFYITDDSTDIKPTLSPPNIARPKQIISSVIPKNQLFPLYGIVLGKTTIWELEKIGIHTTGKDEKGNLYKFYIVDGFNFWYTDGIATSMYLTCYDPLPEPWIQKGFSWTKSYDGYISLFKKLKCSFIPTKKATIVKYQGYKSFDAELKVIFVSGFGNYSLTLGFRYGKGTTTRSTKTLYNISVRAE